MDDIEKTKKYWSGSLGARWYRRAAGKRYLKMHEKITDYLLVRDPKDLLDIACGRGDFLLHFSNRAKDVNLTGTDIAPGMVREAIEKLRGRAKIFESSAESQPFPENSFDAITIVMAFHHLPKRIDTLRSVYKLLRPGGVLVIADMIAKSDFQKKWWIFLERVTGVRGYVGHYTERDIAGLAEEAGFSFSTERILEMPKRYWICKLEKM